MSIGKDFHPIYAMQTPKVWVPYLSNWIRWLSISFNQSHDVDTRDLMELIQISKFCKRFPYFLLRETMEGTRGNPLIWKRGIIIPTFYTMLRELIRYDIHLRHLILSSEQIGSSDEMSLTSLDAIWNVEQLHQYLNDLLDLCMLFFIQQQTDPVVIFIDIK